MTNEIEWNCDFEQCPINTKVWLLSEYEDVYLATVVYSPQGYLTRGECYAGDAEVFYRSKIVAWRKY